MREGEPRGLETELSGEASAVKIPKSGSGLGRGREQNEGGPDGQEARLGLPWWLSAEEPACSTGDRDPTPGWGRSLEKGIATHSSTLAWKIPRTEDPGGLQSVGLQKSHTPLSN